MHARNVLAVVALLLLACSTSIESGGSGSATGSGGAPTGVSSSTGAAGAGGSPSTATVSSSAASVSSSSGGIICMQAQDCPPSGSPCTVAVCTDGHCGTAPAPVSTACNGTCHCDGVGACAGPGCVSDSICSSPSPCLVGKCVGCEVCTVVPAAAGTHVAGSPSGDCQRLACDGNGGIVTVVDDNDVPVDGDPCTVDRCDNGQPSHPPLCQPPQTCSQGICSP